jgi:hypothetical protein
MPFTFTTARSVTRAVPMNRRRSESSPTDGTDLATGRPGDRLQVEGDTDRANAVPTSLLRKQTRTAQGQFPITV